MNYVFHFNVVFDNFGAILQGALLTLEIALAATVMGLLIGIVGAGLKATKVRPVIVVVDIYVEFIRNTPFLVQLFIVFFGFPSLGIRISALEAAILTLGVHLGAYAVEVVRAGIESIHHGQVEGGLSLGMSGLQVFRYIILMPALKTVYPSLVSLFVLIMLDTSIVSAIGVEELTFVGKYLQSRTFRDFEILFSITLVYLAMSFLVRWLFHGIQYLVLPRRR